MTSVGLTRSASSYAASAPAAITARLEDAALALAELRDVLHPALAFASSASRS